MENKTEKLKVVCDDEVESLDDIIKRFDKIGKASGSILLSELETAVAHLDLTDEQNEKYSASTDCGSF